MASGQGNGASRPVGRPRRLTLDEVLDGARALGLDDLNIKDLAAHLGVGVATIYRYVDNRETLVRLAVGRTASQRLPEERGQDWRDAVREYAASLYHSVGANPDIVAGFLTGQFGLEVELEFADHIIGALTRRGFSPAEAMRCFRLIAQVAIGAAVVSRHYDALRTSQEEQERRLAEALARREPDELPALRQAAADFVDVAAARDWRPAVEAIILDIERRRATAGT